jgi:hypothetical protein
MIGWRAPGAIVGNQFSGFQFEKPHAVCKVDAASLNCILLPHLDLSGLFFLIIHHKDFSTEISTRP